MCLGRFLCTADNGPKQMCLKTCSVCQSGPEVQHVDREVQGAVAYHFLHCSPHLFAFSYKFKIAQCAELHFLSKHLKLSYQIQKVNVPPIPRLQERKKKSIDTTSGNIPYFGLVCNSTLICTSQNHLLLIASLWCLLVRITEHFANTKLLLSDFFLIWQLQV